MPSSSFSSSSYPMQSKIGASIIGAHWLTVGRQPAGCTVLIKCQDKVRLQNWTNLVKIYPGWMDGDLFKMCLMTILSGLNCVRLSEYPLIPLVPNLEFCKAQSSSLDPKASKFMPSKISWVAVAWSERFHVGFVKSRDVWVREWELRLVQWDHSYDSQCLPKLDILTQIHSKQLLYVLTFNSLSNIFANDLTYCYC